MSCVEVFATGIKTESKQSKALSGANQGIKNCNQSRPYSCNLTFDYLKIKRSRASGNDQAIFADQKPKA